MPSVPSRSNCSRALRRSSSWLLSSRVSARGPRAMRFETCRRASPTTGRSRRTSSRLRKRSATALSLPPSRPTWASFGETGRAATVTPPVQRHRDHVRGARDRDRRGREVHKRRHDEGCPRGCGVLRPGDRVDLVAISPSRRAGARGMTAVDTVDATVEALCGDLSAIRAPRGTRLNARSWATEAPLRMLLNNLDANVAERPEELIVYGGSGKAARNHESLKAIVGSLLKLGDDETLLVQSGKPVGVFRTHPGAPRVLIANANLVGRWATWDVFRELERQGLTMYGQMTAGSWIYIGSQGILQGTYETFGAVARQHFGGTLAGRLVLTAGLGGMGGAQPLAATMHGAAFLGIEVDPARIAKRVATGYCDRQTASLDDALAWVAEAKAARRALSVGLVGNAAEVVPELVRRGVVPDVLTDQTSAHDTLNGYVPAGMSLEAAAALRRTDAAQYVRQATASIVEHVRAMLALRARGAITFDYGNNLRTVAHDAGLADAFAFPGFVPAYVRPLFCEGKGPFRCVALSGDPKDLARTDELVLELFPHDEHLVRWITLAREKVQFQGLPARICWLGQGARARFGVALNDLVEKGEIPAPIVI